mmetsp:Transcript_9064/g.15577  ORF Transcript_9064/g.15577 Transcript_9064/m.15577 type:complete len:255 (-) Transcript_9064:472-1236(-)|eukprot:CAMPEP_0198211628 /NCGR_PEP_ID=MMETSP1445-20131203/24865_1 /TAXON_ID=36898 /ORGANISM="Pyramimonas sp., Strain CCMP2087" /LENGTH=254 /DNA_ID=CAMNT_0043885927 /DNA_START=196 /DNA_END=960 /DNA_ORIENTATION=-
MAAASTSTITHTSCFLVARPLPSGESPLRQKGARSGGHAARGVVLPSNSTGKHKLLRLSLHATSSGVQPRSHARSVCARALAEDAQDLDEGDDDEDNFEEVDFDFAASVVRETWELVQEATGKDDKLEVGKFFYSILEEISPDIKQIVDEQSAQEAVERRFLELTSELVAATTNTDTLPAKVQAANERFTSYGVDAVSQFPLVAQAVLLTLDEFFHANDFTVEIEEAWVTVLGVFNQLLIDPKGDYFVDVAYDD